MAQGFIAFDHFTLGWEGHLSVGQLEMVIRFQFCTFPPNGIGKYEKFQLEIREWSLEIEGHTETQSLDIDRKFYLQRIGIPVRSFLVCSVQRKTFCQD